MHRDSLVEAITTNLVEQGLVGASLDRLAAAAHTSARMLVHHFGSRDAVIELALDRARRRQMAAARAALPPSGDFISHLAAAWPWFINPLTGKYFKLFSQVASVELTDGEHTLRSGMVDEWLDVFQSGFAAVGYSRAAAQTLATITSAQLRGLFLDLDATADTQRVERAYRHFVSLLEAEAPPANTGP
jgi:AcrR family transcriptional regulator